MKTEPELTIIKGDNYTCDKPHCAFCMAEKRGTYRHNGWTKSELFILENEYKKTHISELEKILNRSRKAIWTKANRIKDLGYYK